jgi:hypothetical protein
VDRARARNKYRLVFLLFPPPESADDSAYFGQVRAWLDQQGVEHVDLAQLFAREHLTAGELYWKYGHWNQNGNRAVGRLLARQFP